jgi:hypothetical protein
MKETLWRNKRKFVKVVPIIYDNFIIIVITVSQKIGGIAFLTPLVIREAVNSAW